MNWQPIFIIPFTWVVLLLSGVATVALLRQQSTDRSAVYKQAGNVLPKARAELEVKVLQRTAELARTNALLQEEIAKRKQLEQQIIQSERLATLGRMAAALAHEVSNPLQIIRSYLDLIMDFPLEPDEKERYLQIICCEIERLREVSQNMLHYAGSHPVQQQYVSVADLIEQVLVLTSKELQKRGIQVTTDIQDVRPVMAVREQLIQVFLNLVINVIESTSDDSGLLEIALWSKNGRVIVSFTNDGPAIPSSALPHIFQPFYTTKSEGNGLGLWVSHNLIRRHTGTLGVENLGVERGVRFTVTLPAASALGIEI